VQSRSLQGAFNRANRCRPGALERSRTNASEIAYANQGRCIGCLCVCKSTFRKQDQRNLLIITRSQLDVTLVDLTDSAKTGASFRSGLENAPPTSLQSLTAGRNRNRRGF
jgi:hypothetical protein